VPPGIDGEKLVGILRERHHITVAGGQDQAKGKIVRVANMGYVDKFDILTVVSAIEMALQELGHPVELGRGVAAAMKVFAEG
jgi:aspartate aminotransferase-like enzyme